MTRKERDYIPECIYKEIEAWKYLVLCQCHLDGYVAKLIEKFSHFLINLSL